MTVSRIVHIKELENAVPQSDSAILQRIDETDTYTTMAQIGSFLTDDIKTAARQETEARQQADAELLSKINAETSDRASADTVLQTNIDNEATARENADTALSERITSNKNAIDILNGTDEGSVAKTVNDKIAEVIADAPESLDTLKEIADWISGHEDSAAAMNTAIQTNAANIAQEISDRQLDTVTLQGNIDNEKTARENADSTLQNNIDAEASARESADDTLRTDLGNEESARITADTTLQSNIDALSSSLEAERTARQNGDAETISTITETFSSQIETIVNDKVDEVIDERLGDYDTAISGLQSGKNDKITVTADTDALSDTSTVVSASGTNPTSFVSHALSKFWTYISGKLTGAVSTVLTSNLTASRAVISNANGKLAVSGVTSTQLGYLSGVTGDIQTQLNAKQASGSYKTTQTAKSDPTASGTTITAIDTISQDAQGVITATKKTIRSASTSQTGVVQLNDTVTSTSTTQALTANRGRLLANSISSLDSAVSNMQENLYDTNDAVGDLSDSVSDLKAKTTDLLLGKWFSVSQANYSNGMDLTSYVNSQLDSGYKFLCWTNVSSSGWVMPKPVYIANSLNPAGYPYYDASTVGGQVDFTFLEIKS